MIFKLAIKRILDQKLYSSLIVLALSLIFALFITFSQSINEYKRGLSSVSNEQILIAGGTQGHLETIFNSLYFKKGFVKSFESHKSDNLKPYGEVIPVFNRYTAFNQPIIGISSQYFSFNQLSLEQGNMFIKLGQCVLGAKAAEHLNLQIGDHISSDADAGFDIKKSIPVKMVVCGILKPQNSPTDFAIFTSLKTVWTMHGIGHQHLENETSSQAIVDLTKEPLVNFHFHGEEKNYPLTSVLIYTHNEQSKAELQALALENELPLQIINPEQALTQIDNSIMGVSKFFYFLFSMLSTALLLIFFVFIFQSSKIRSQEKLTYEKLGISSSFYKKLLSGEWILLILLSLSLGYLISMLLQPFMASQITSILAS